MKAFLKIIFFVNLLLLIAGSSFAQHYDPSRISTKAQKMYNDGITKAQDGNYNEAISFFQQAIYLEPNYVDALLSLAGVYGQMRNNEPAVEFYLLNYQGHYFCSFLPLRL